MAVPFYFIEQTSVMGELEGPELTFRQITGCAATMPSQVLPTNKNKYILAIFTPACENTIFHNKWMTTNTWAESICLHYEVPEGIHLMVLHLAKPLH